MKPFTAILYCVMLPFTAYASVQGDRPMTNQDVIHLVKLRLSAEVIITTINNSAANFDLSVNGLTALSQGGVPSEIIKAMQAKASTNPKIGLPSVGGSGGGAKELTLLPGLQRIKLKKVLNPIRELRAR